MCELWKATSESTRRTVQPSAAHCSAASSTAVMSPATTVEVGEAAMAAHSEPSVPMVSHGESSVPMVSRTSSNGRSTMIMAPLPATLRSSAERRHTSRAPSDSDSTPATTAAAISPTEWPMIAPGTTP